MLALPSNSSGHAPSPWPPSALPMTPRYGRYTGWMEAVDMLQHLPEHLPRRYAGDRPSLAIRDSDEESPQTFIQVVHLLLPTIQCGP